MSEETELEMGRRLYAESKAAEERARECEEVLRLLVVRIRLDIRCGTLPPQWGNGIMDRARELFRENSSADRHHLAAAEKED